MVKAEVTWCMEVERAAVNYLVGTASGLNWA